MASVDHLFEHSHNETQAEQEYASRDLKAKFSWETTLSQKIPGNAQSPPTLQGISRRGPLPFLCSSLDSKEKKKKGRKKERKTEVPNLQGQAYLGLWSDQGWLIF